MFTIRPTSNLAKRMHIKLGLENSKPTTRLGDWHAMELSIFRQQMILCVSENGRLPVLMPAAPYSEFQNRLPLRLAEVLMDIGIHRELINDELKRMTEYQIAKTNNRSVVGTMKDYRDHIIYKQEYDRTQIYSFLEGSIYLAETPCLKMEHTFPIQAVQEIFKKPILQLLN